MYRKRSFKNILNDSVPSIEHCGTPSNNSRNDL